MEEKTFSISEVSKITNVKPHILRYWETEFNILRPLRIKGGQRRYTVKDIEIIKQISYLLYVKGYRLAGAKKWLNNQGKDYKNDKYLELIELIRKNLKEIIKLLD